MIYNILLAHVSGQYLAAPPFITFCMVYTFKILAVQAGTSRLFSYSKGTQTGKYEWKAFSFSLHFDWTDLQCYTRKGTYNIATSKKDDSAPRPGLKILESLKESRFFEVQDYLRFAAGGIAGGVQSLVATPLDNISLRFQANDMINGKHSSYLGFVKTEFKASNIHELYKCFRLTFVKDTLGFSVFFGFYGLMLRKTREIMESNVRIQDFVYNKLSIDGDVVARKEIDIFSMKNLPGFIIQSGCTLISGATCALMYQIADYPLDQFRSKVLVNQLSDSWVLSGKYRNSRFLKKKKIKILSSPYMYTWKQICSEVLAKTPNEKANSTVTTLRALRSLYSGWLVVALRAVPATSLGLVVYEFVKDTVGIESY
ncbi:hypothetical protein AX774_g693 [Zancudomyces culisetae]|uniref:Mitochondrial carrier n=1 Tax=Zancudomyces culisetae TaxID=1213189 RepID=A0A1R1PFC9_ZANCU|nr:hypothetical protein AX774_g6959 [Zancudomyces culisetae]OMH85746.1 hypothetical protein AX774_g693 [Zancudomyces culisetae]|eukprot:OMH79629.1 hypothetical protein AX774_g6959 [Zancudomyces culisetae]